MTAQNLIPSNTTTEIASSSFLIVPTLFANTGEKGIQSFLEFFTANIPNLNTRLAYARAVGQFSFWCEQKGFTLNQLTPIHVSAYIQELSEGYSRPTAKQSLAAIRMLFHYLVIGQVMSSNPASSVRGPKHVVRKGKTPVLTTDEARQLLDCIDVSKIAGLRDRALIGVMVYSFARIGAVVSMNVDDYYQQGKRWWLRLHEKGGKFHEVPAHHKVEEFLDMYIEAAGITGHKGEPLFRSLNRKRQLTSRRLMRQEALPMVKRRAKSAGLGDSLCNHSFRATGITCFLENGGTIEKAQQIAAHESPRTTKLYDRTSNNLCLEEIERIRI